MMHRPRRSAPPARRRGVGPLSLVAVLFGMCIWSAWFVSCLLAPEQSAQPEFLHLHPRRLSRDPFRSARLSSDAAALPATAAGDSAPPEDGPKNLRNSAIVTLVGGDSSARHALVLFQRLRDVGTRIPHVVALLARGGHGSDACHNATWKRSVGRASVDCGSNETIAEEIVSPDFLHLFRKLGVEVRVIDPIPRTPFTRDIAGRLDSFWGYALSRLVAFNMTEFGRVVLMDSDTLVLRNIDHLVDAPHFSAALGYSCCNHHALPRISGGLWAFDPSVELGALAWRMMAEGQPTLLSNGTRDPTRGPSSWNLGDTGLAMFALSDWNHGEYAGYWPKVADRRHGYVPGLRRLPAYRNLNDSEFALATRDYNTGAQLREGFLPETHDVGRPGGRFGFGLPGLEWHALSILYDQAVGSICECSSITGRDLPDESFTVHLGCLQYGGRPGDHESEAAFLRLAYRYSTSCSRHYFAIWLDALRRTGYVWPGPRWDGPALPGANQTHDALVLEWRKADGKVPLIA